MFVHGVDVPDDWEALSLDELMALAKSLDAYHVDERPIARDVRQAILAASDLGSPPKPPKPRRAYVPATRVVAAFEMRRAGRSWPDIAATLRYKHSASAQKVVSYYCETTGVQLPRVTSHQRHHHRKPTRCPKGHEFTPENTHVRYDGHWHCRKCRSAKRQREREKGFR